MQGKLLLSIAALTPILAGCDGFYESRMVISGDPANIAPVSNAVREYATENDLSCSPRSGTIIYCSKQPVAVFVTVEAGAIVVCYFARGAQIESSKFAGRIERLRTALEAAVQPRIVEVSDRQDSDCLIPRA
jgi:hypothetical protein